MINQKQQEDRKKRNKEILELYPNLTFKEIGKKYHISPQRIHQIIKKEKDIERKEEIEVLES